jgi:hypothetical protein
VIDGLSEAGSGFFVPKNAEGLAARETDLVLAFERGLDETFGVPAGVNALAAGFGLNSRAFTLNFVEMVEVGV